LVVVLLVVVVVGAAVLALDVVVVTPSDCAIVIYDSTNLGAAVSKTVVTNCIWIRANKIMTHSQVVSNFMSHNLKCIKSGLCPVNLKNFFCLS
jgi:hypothetical protein